MFHNKRISVIVTALFLSGALFFHPSTQTLALKDTQSVTLQKTLNVNTSTSTNVKGITNATAAGTSTATATATAFVTNANANTTTNTTTNAYKGRVFYEIFVRSFQDSNGDGIGDLKGVIQKLDYLKSLGIKGIWLMPINSSPSYHGYDVSDYYNINSQYGTMEDFKQLIQEAHKRDIKVEMDLVINHTSTQHEWFKEASADKNSKYRNYYVWTADKNLAEESSPISAQPWTPIGSEYYYSIFWSGMPDLNYDNPKVREEMKKIAKYYLELGVDGFRLDAAMWIYTNDETKNLAWWKEYSSYIKSINKNAVLVGEVWQSSSKQIAPYMKVLDSCFNFPLADSIVTGMQSGSMGHALAIAGNAYDKYKAANASYIDSPFLTNHDMNRSMNTFQNIDKAKRAAAMLLTMPGTPYIYYGEETGMMGYKPDERIRQPMIWDNKDKSKNTSWESSDNFIDKIAVNVQEKDKNSLLNFYRSMIKLRNSNNALKLGDFKALETTSDSVVAYKRSYQKEQVYVYINTGKAKANEKIDLKKATVLFTNIKTSSSISFKGKVTLGAYQILILKK